MTATTTRNYPVEGLSWMPLNTPEDVEAARRALIEADKVAIRVLALPKSKGARKTLAHQWARDLRQPAWDPKPLRLTPRGGRLWRHRPEGTRAREPRVGWVAVVPRDFNLLRCLHVLRGCVEVAPCPPSA